MGRIWNKYGGDMEKNQLKGIFSRESDEWSTPDAFFQDLDREFHFTLDPCASDENHKCEWYYTKEQDGSTESTESASGVLWAG